MFARMLIRFYAAMEFLTSLVFGLIGGLLLDCALLASAALLFDVREFSWVNPLSWAVPLHWNWDTIWKAAVIGLPVWIVSLLRRNRFGQTLIVVIPTWVRPRSNLNGLHFGAFDAEPAPRRSVRDELKKMSPFGISRYRNFDPSANPELARHLVNTGAVDYMTASGREATIKAAGQPDPDNN